MSWENGTRNIFFARGLNSYAEAQLDALESEPFVKLTDRLHQLGILNQNVRYRSNRCAPAAEVPEAPKWLGTLFVEPLSSKFKPGNLAYRDILRAIVWLPDALTTDWIANDMRIDLTRAEVALCQSRIDSTPVLVGTGTSLTGPLEGTGGSHYIIRSGRQYEADLTTMWDANLCEAPAGANLQKFYDVTEVFVGAPALPLPFPVTHQEYVGPNLR